MAKNDIRARLLKQRGTLASETVTLTFGEVEVRELKADRIDVIREVAKRSGDDRMAYLRLVVAECVYVDGELLINKAFMDEAGEFDKNVLVDQVFRYGDIIKAYETFERLIGIGDAKAEVEELKN